MHAADRIRLDAWLLEAAALEAEEREAFLDRLASSEPRAAAEIRRRLEAAGEITEDFLRPPGTTLCRAATRRARLRKAPESNDRYRIQECLGEGGMAHVYKAFDHQLGRPVALKILEPSREGDDTGGETPQRLLREARAQARVRHDHVLDVYETGWLGDQPYIAVRYVAGGTLADVAAGDLPLERKVRLVAQAAEGLHAAHRQGLIHGDVKPSNVLVEETDDGELRAWVGDFGIAVEATGGGDHEGTGVVVGGTPNYMAPELLGGTGSPADRRSDVYSLGVTLHRVVTGSLPERGAVRFEDLRRRHPALPPDLMAVVGRCLAARPNARYPSARAVAEDLWRFLDGDVVSAYADRAVYRWSRFAVRNRRLLAVAGVASVLLAAALVTAAILGLQAVRANALAENRRDQAEDLIGFMLEDLRDKLESVGRLDLLDDVGEEAMDYFGAVPEAALSDEELSRRSQALYQIGDVRIRKNDLAGAEAPLRESLALARELFQRDPDDSQRLYDLGQSEFWAGFALWKRGELDGAHDHFARYHAVSRELVRRDAANPDWQRELAYAESNLGSVLQQRGDLEGALERFRVSLALDLQRVREAADEAEADRERHALAGSHNTLAVILARLGRLDEAQEHFETALELRRGFYRADPSDVRRNEALGTAHHFLGRFLQNRGDPSATVHLETAVDIFEELVVRDPSNEIWLLKGAASVLALAQQDRFSGRWGQARRRIAVASDRISAGSQNPNASLTWRLLAVEIVFERIRLGLLSEAPDVESLREEAMRTLASLPPAEPSPGDPKLPRLRVEGHLLLGDLEAALGRPTTASEHRRRAWDDLSPVVTPTCRDPELLRTARRVLTVLEDKPSAEAMNERLRRIGVSV